MDPVAIAGLIASIVSIMDATMKVVGFMNDIKVAENDQARLVQEVTNLVPFLNSLKSKIEIANNKDLWFARIRILTGKGGAIDQLEAAITGLARLLDKLYGKSKVTRALGWTLKKEECNAFLARIEWSKSLIAAELHADHFALSQTKADTSLIPVLAEGLEQLKIGYFECQTRNELQRRHEIEGWLSPLNFFETQSDKLSQRLEGTGKWLLDSPEYQEQDPRQLAYRILSWISYALRPLTVDELRHALEVELGEFTLDEENLIDEGDVTAVCAGLVTVETEGRIVRMVHYTTQDYFERIRETRFPEVRSSIATACLAYLSYKDVELRDAGHRFYFEDSTVRSANMQSGHLEEIADIHEPFSGKSWDAVRSTVSSHYTSQGVCLEFYDYAAHYWTKHLRGKPEAELQLAGLEFIRSDQARYTSMSTLRFWWVDRVIADELCVAVVYDLQILCQAMLSPSIVDIRSAEYISDERIDNALIFSGTFGRARIAEILMRIQRWRAGDNQECSPITSAVLSASIEAAWSGNRATVCVLLDKEREDGDIESPYAGIPSSGPTIDNQKGKTPQTTDLDSVGTEDKVIEALMEQGFDVTMPLIGATGNEACLKRAIDQGWDLEETETRYHKTALIVAAEIGRTAIVDLLLSNGANVDARDQWMETALHYAALNGNFEIVKLLIAAGADPEAETDDGQTPLQYLTFRSGTMPGDMPQYLKCEERFAEVYDFLLEAIEQKT